MSFSDSNKSEIVEKYKTHATDSGSPEVQVALLTTRIEALQKHFKTNNKDNHSKRGMMRLISVRKSLLSYLKRKSKNRYQTLISSLGLRK